MELTRRNAWVYGLLAAVWALVLVWQVEEHARVKEYAKNNLRNRSKDIANTLGSFIRGLQVRGEVFPGRLQPVLDELVNGRTNDLVRSSEVLAVALLNASNEPVALAGATIDLGQKDILQENERWGLHTMTVAYPIQGASVSPQGGTNLPAPVLIPFTNSNVRGEGPRFPRRGEPRPGEAGATNVVRNPDNPDDHGPGPRERDHEREGRLEARPPGEGPPPPGLGPRPRRPWWALRLNDQEFQAVIKKRELHGLVLALSTENLQALCQHDLWLRFIISFFATIAAVGTGFAWRNLVKSSDLQIRLVRASELNSHLKEMNLAAAGLAHETRNPLNIIRGLAQMISKQAELPPETHQKSREIIDQADKVAAQLNEFINYSRPREVRRSRLALDSVIAEVVRPLSYDLEEKKIRLETKGEKLMVEADDQLLRQALFNLLLNATQAVAAGGEIQIVTEKRGATEAVLEVRDNGPGVPPERRTEIFKPYFTTQEKGTGLGLAVVQQIVLAHGWEIQCLGNEPKGACFRITHLKLAP